MKSIEQIKTNRRRWLLFWHCMVCVWVLLMYAPVPNPETFIVQGYPQEYKSCGRTCSTSIVIGSIRLGCSADILGHAYSCANFYNPQKIARATYFVHPTILSTLGISSQSLILLRFEQDNRVLRDKSYGDLIFPYCFSTLLVILFFAITFYQLRKLNYFKKEV